VYNIYIYIYTICIIYIYIYYLKKLVVYILYIYILYLCICVCAILCFIRFNRMAIRVGSPRFLDTPAGHNFCPWRDWGCVTQKGAWRRRTWGMYPMIWISRISLQNPICWSFSKFWAQTVSLSTCRFVWSSHVAMFSPWGLPAKTISW